MLLERAAAVGSGCVDPDSDDYLDDSLDLGGEGHIPKPLPFSVLCSAKVFTQARSWT